MYYGTIGNSWKISGNQLSMDVEIPANTTATVYVPASGESAITESGNNLSSINNIKVNGTEAGYVVLQLGSGKYNFKVTR